MSLVHALDRYYLALTLLVTVGYQLTGFAIAWTLQFDKITDFTGGSNFFFLALLTLLCGNTFYTRNIVASVLVMVWAVRIAGFLLFRVLKMGSDTRFDDIRSNFWKFLGFWVGQILWIWTVSLPLTILNSPAISDLSSGGSNPKFGTSRDIAGIVLWAVGFIIESVADGEKFYYKSRKIIPRNEPTNRGLWRWSRHPPYFGEILCWWGIWILCLSPTTNGQLSSSGRAAQNGAVVAPIFTTLLLLFASGVPTAEKPTARRFFLLSNGPHASEADTNAWTEYKAYLAKTSILIPFPPALYRRLPRVVKRTVFLDFPMYNFDEATDGAKAVEEACRNMSR
ncbi:hypothetical protein D9619_006167 [Psilocybe cf. subviscida]|uniref:Steroid 5-alpha reductase C-terminal domain-containing protein n=1 Tax=Psilocybe cf. subviscida TaxID=2480587 RepID=A0A8H5B4M3_9AGAR|nr:hypothetical protein D9619_006167 [Psilocybe cf. subviscida]